MDGVLVDSMHLHTECWREYLQQHGIRADGIEERMLGKRNDELVPFWFGTGLTQEEVAAHGARKEALYRERMRPQLSRCLVAGLKDFLEQLEPLPKALVSNAEAANVQFILEEAGLSRYFRVVVDGHQVARPKPAPDLYLRAAELLGVGPEECVVFEDSPGGVAAGRAAGARVVGLTTTMAKLEDVDLTIKDFRDPALQLWLEALQ